MKTAIIMLIMGAIFYSMGTYMRYKEEKPNSIWDVMIWNLPEK